MHHEVIYRFHQQALEALQEALQSLGVELEQPPRLIPPAEASMGDLGFPCHPLARILRKNPKIIAQEVADKVPLGQGILSAEALNGYVNLRFDPALLLPQAIAELWQEPEEVGRYTDHQGQRLLIEFSSPNTNKPQHLGHARNNVLGMCTANLLEAVGFEVTRANIINDRGIHICKSMLAYQHWGQETSPEKSQRKGDFLVGEFYVLFEEKFQQEYETWREEHPDQKEKINKDEYFNTLSPLGAEVQKMLQQWEKGDEAVRALWEKMNSWVFAGFEKTYERMGIRFDWMDYESETYLLGKDLVQQGLDKGVFTVLEGGAVACDLTQVGLQGKKVLLRSDGTSVYMTQDLGTAFRRYNQLHPQRMIYVVADEQNYHFQVLFQLLNLLEEGLGDRCYHLSYGMVELPHGRMKTREGNVVDADLLMDELAAMALAEVEQRYPHLEEEEKKLRAERIGQAGLKFYILKFTPASRIKFNPEQSISFDGETGPYCLYSYARAGSIAAKLPPLDQLPPTEELALLGSDLEAQLGKLLVQFPIVVREAADNTNPARLAGYLWQLARAFSAFYQDRHHRVIDADPPLQRARLALLQAVRLVLRRGLHLLGIEPLEQM